MGAVKEAPHSDTGKDLVGSVKATAKTKKKAPPKPSVFKHMKEDTDTVVITANDINRIKVNSVILTPAMRAQMEKEKYEERMRNSAIANQRKEMMLKMEEERKKKSGAISESEKIKKELDAIMLFMFKLRTLQKAAMLTEEQIDDVKRMNQMMLYARCVTIRDEQKKEKGGKIKELKQYNQEVHEAMMAKLFKEQRLHDLHEAMKHQQRMDGAAVIRHQIQEREAQRKIDEELKQLEGLRIRRVAEKNKLEDERLAKEKHEEGQRLYRDLMKANADNAEQRRIMKELEREELKKIQLYNYKKAVAEQERADEAERVKKQKELEIARLRSMQEKAQDQQAALDELRAQRVQEAVEREWREKEKAAAERLKKMNEDLAEAREQQKMFKITQLAEQAKQERIEFFKIIKEQQEALIKAKIVAEQQHARNIRNRDEILGQIAKNKEVRIRAIKEKFEEGARARLKLLAEFERLRQIKERKLKELEREGVPQKYRAELARKKVVIN